MSLKALKKFIDELINASRVSQESMLSKTAHAASENGETWHAGLLKVLALAIQIRNTSAGEKVYKEYQKNATDLVFLVMQAIKVERAHVLKDEQSVEILIYFLFLDAIENKFFYHGESRELQKSIIAAAKTDALDEAFTFINNPKAKNNRFTKLRKSIKKNHHLKADDYRCDKPGFPLFIADWLNYYFANRLLQQSAILPNAERYQLIQDLARRLFDNAFISINSAEDEFNFYEQCGARIWKQYSHHGIFTEEFSLWKQLLLEQYEICLRFVDQNQSFHANLASKEGVPTLSLLKEINLSDIYAQQYHLKIINEPIVFRSVCFLLSHFAELPINARHYLLEYSIELLFNLLKFGDLRSAFSVSVDSIQLNYHLGNKLPEVINCQEMANCFLSAFSPDDFTRISKMEFTVILAKKRGETNRDFCMRYLINILVKATSAYMEHDKISKTCAIFRHLCADQRIQWGALKQKMTYFKLYLQALNIMGNFEQESRHIAVNKQDAALLKEFFGAYIDAEIRNELKQKVIAYLEKKASEIFSTPLDIADHAHLIDALQAMTPLLTSLGANEEECKALRIAYQEDELTVATTQKEQKLADERKALAKALEKEEAIAKAKKDKEKREKKNKKQAAGELKKQQAANKNQKKLIKQTAKEQQLEAQRAAQSAAAKKALEQSKKPDPEPEPATKSKKKKKKKKKAATVEVQNPIQLADSPAEASSSNSANRHAFFLNQDIPRDKLPAELFEVLAVIREQKNAQEFILTAGALESLCLGEMKAKDYDCLLINFPVEQLQKPLKDAGFTDIVVVGKYAILLCKKNGIDIEIHSLNLAEGENLHTALRNDAQQRDIVSTAMYITLTNEARLQLFDPLNGREILKNKEIALNPQEKFFEDDPIRLLRVVKALSKRPAFELNDDAKATLQAIDNSTLWKNYLYNEKNDLKLHRGRIKTALDKLLPRFESKTIVNAMQKTGILEGLTGIPPRLLSLSEKLFALPGIKDKPYRFFVVAAAIYFYSRHDYKEEKTELHNWPLYAINMNITESEICVWLYEFFINDLKMETRGSDIATQLMEKIVDETGYIPVARAKLL